MTTLSRKPTASPAKRRSSSKVWVLTAALAAAGALGVAVYLGKVDTARLRSTARDLAAAVTPTPHTPPPADAPLGPHPAWDGSVHVTPKEEETIGFHFAEVKAQTDPLKLELTGRTAYDPNTITKIRPRFDTRVEHVFASLGQKIKKGDPLVELYSTDLATAKSDFQVKYVQWQHDLKLYNLRKKLVETGAISQQVWVDTQNDEQKSRLDFNLAHDKLSVFYEVPKEEIDPLLSHLSDETRVSREFGSISDKARMTIRSKADGFVIEREVVEGNYYESTDVLMQIAPLDHLWVWVNVYEVDQHKVSKGQLIEIQFPFLSQRVEGKVDYVAPEVSKDTRAVRIRATIPNPDTRLKADMLVKAQLEIPPVPGQTVIPRLAMVAINGEDYAYIRVPRDKAAPGDRREDRFVRARIDVSQENSDHVVVARGLRPGQEVVTNGSLVISQLYEDQLMTVTGLPLQ